MHGTIKTMNSRGFGFITDSEGIDYFFHYTDVDIMWKILVQDWLRNKKNMKVEFEVDEKSNDGPKAKNVKVERIGEAI